MERALDDRERERLGAHYTPRAYVERLVLPTIIEPLRADWEAVKAAAVELAGAGDKSAASLWRPQSIGHSYPSTGAYYQTTGFSYPALY